MRDWLATTWSCEHPQHGYFFVTTCADGALATHVHQHNVLTIAASDQQVPHRSVSAAMLACERRIEQLDLAAVRAEDLPTLRLVSQ
jgi:glycosylphosphatidylinositol transamidase (GPIT) subunit GPI8